jgi:lipopolysaccharide export LptBFGC system permease protein LptF
LQQSGYNVSQLRMAYWDKSARAAVPLVMVLIGLPFAFRVGRRGSLYGIGVALLLVLVYWAAFAVFGALGQQALLPPQVAAWAPNVLFSLVGLYLMLFIRT